MSNQARSKVGGRTAAPESAPRIVERQEVDVDQMHDAINVLLEAEKVVSEMGVKQNAWSRALSIFFLKAVHNIELDEDKTAEISESLEMALGIINMARAELASKTCPTCLCSLGSEVHREYCADGEVGERL